MLARLTGLARRVSRAAALTGGVLILLSALVIFVDVVARKLIGWTLGGADELSGYALAISTAWALPYCLLWRANIRVDSLYRLTPLPARAALDVVALLVLGAFVAILSYRACLVLSETVAQGSRSVTPLSVPLIVPQSVWVVGLLWYSACVALILLRAALAFVRGDFGGVAALAGTGAAESEAADAPVV